MSPQDFLDPLEPGGFEFVIPIRTTTGLNAREHWAVKAKRVKRERKATRFYWHRQAIRLNLAPNHRWRVELTRFLPAGTLPDTDNVVGGLKAMRDQLALHLGINDGDRRHLWVYGSRKGEWGVRVRIYQDPIVLPAVLSGDVQVRP